MNEGEVLEPNLRGLSDTEEYDNDELPHEYDNDNGEIIKDAFVTFKLPNKMEDYKWEVWTYFATNDDFKEAIRTYVIHSGRNLKFKKNDKRRMRVKCKDGCSWGILCKYKRARNLAIEDNSGQTYM